MPSYRLGSRSCSIYTQRGYYAVLRKNKNMKFAATWMVLENVTLSEVGQKEKNR